MSTYNVKPVWGSSKPALRDANWESGDDRKLAHNTYRSTWDGRPCVIFHSTTIIIAQGNGEYILRNGGHQTSTTKQRLNALLPGGISVFQKDWTWYVTDRDGTREFFDNMIVRY